jgi:Zn-finger nucleic acid-binding protein
VSCGGVWFDAGELVEYRARLSGVAGSHHEILRDFTADRALASARCPKCDGVLRSGRAAGYRLLQCSGCKGVFMPGSEVKSMSDKWKVGFLDFLFDPGIGS